MKDKQINYFMIVIMVFIVTLLLVYKIVFSADGGNFGDYFGGIFGLVLGIAAFIILLKILRDFQRRNELRDFTEVIKMADKSALEIYNNHNKSGADYPVVLCHKFKILYDYLKEYDKKSDNRIFTDYYRKSRANIINVMVKKLESQFSLDWIANLVKADFGFNDTDMKIDRNRKELLKAIKNYFDYAG